MTEKTAKKYRDNRCAGRDTKRRTLQLSMLQCYRHLNLPGPNYHPISIRYQQFLKQEESCADPPVCKWPFTGEGLQGVKRIMTSHRAAGKQSKLCSCGLWQRAGWQILSNVSEEHGGPIFNTNVQQQYVCLYKTVVTVCCQTTGCCDLHTQQSQYVPPPPKKTTNEI